MILSKLLKKTQKFKTLQKGRIHLNLHLSCLFSSKSTPTNQYEKNIPFDRLKISNYLKTNCKKHKYKYLTPIQEKAFPYILEKQSAAIFAETGSGKTLTYILPIMEELLKNPSKSGMHGALILTPNKELTIQIYSEARKLDPDNKLKISRLGSISHVTPHLDYISKTKDERPSRQTLQNLSEQNVINTVNWKRLDMLIGTPQRLDSIIKAKNRVDGYDLNPQFLVIDEFDQILDNKNLFESLKYILRQFAGLSHTHLAEYNQRRTVVLAGASLQKSYNKVETEMLIRDWFPGIHILKTENYLKVNSRVKHEAFNTSEVDESDKMLLLEQVIKEHFDELQGRGEALSSQKVMVFVKSAISAEDIAKSLNQNMIACSKLHSKMKVNDRVQAVSEFKEGSKSMVLVCTDVGARGLDFENLGLVVQYDFAQNALSLLHRFGRTGRLNKEGKVVSFLEAGDDLLFHEFEDARVEGRGMQHLFSQKRSFSKKRKFEDEDSGMRYQDPDREGEQH